MKKKKKKRNHSIFDLKKKLVNKIYKPMVCVLMCYLSFGKLFLYVLQKVF